MSALDGAGLRLVDAALPARQFFDLVKGRRLSSADIEVIWFRFKRFRTSGTAGVLDDELDRWSLAELTCVAAVCSTGSRSA